MLVTLRLEFITVVPAVLSSIAERHLGDTLDLAVTAEQEVRTVLVSALTDLGLVTAVWTVWPAVTTLTRNKYQPDLNRKIPAQLSPSLGEHRSYQRTATDHWSTGRTPGGPGRTSG